MKKMAKGMMCGGKAKMAKGGAVKDAMMCGGKVKKMAKGGVAQSSLKSMGRNMAKAANQKKK